MLLQYLLHFLCQYNCTTPSSSSSLGPVANASDILQPWRLIVLPYPPLLFLRRPHFCRQVPHTHNDARDPSSERQNCVGDKVLVILPKWRLPHNLGIFYVPQIYDMGLTALLPLRRKACWGFFCPEKSWRLRLGLKPRTRVLKGSTLPLNHWSRVQLLKCKYFQFSQF